MKKAIFLISSFVLIELIGPYVVVARSEISFPKVDSALIAATKKALPGVVIITSEKTLTPPHTTTLGDMLVENQLFSPLEIDPILFEVKVEAPAQEMVRRGSGFIASEEGYVITNNHVVFDKSLTYTITLQDKSQKVAKVIYSDPVSDIALLEIDGDFNSVSTLGDSSTLKEGQTVAAIGTAYGRLDNSVSLGTVRDFERNITVINEKMTNQNLYDLIESTAYTVPGFSGGPVIDMKGNVIGMSVAAKGVSSFFIPINTIKADLYSYIK